jgi:DEAD/DEAH box helicase domain-containing protein
VAIRQSQQEEDWSVIDITHCERRLLETVCVTRALFSLYDGAIYVYQGKTYLVENFNAEKKQVLVRAVRVSWLTKQR